MSRGGATAELDVRAGFCTVTSPSVGDATRPDARRASKAPVKSPVEALASGEASDPGSEAERGGAGAGAGATGTEGADGNEGDDRNEGDDGNEGKEGAAGAGTEPIVGIWLVSPGSDEKERMPGGIRVFADSSMARRASPASVDRERSGGRGVGTGAGAEGCAGEASTSKSGMPVGGEAGVTEGSKRAIASPVGVREGDGIFLRAARRSTASPVTNVRTSTAASFSLPSSPGSSSAQTTPASRSRMTIGTRRVRAGACPPRARRSGPVSLGGSASTERCDLSTAATNGSSSPPRSRERTASSRPPDASNPRAFQPVSRSFRRTRRATRDACAFTRVRNRERTSTCVRADSMAASEPRTTVQSAWGAPEAGAAAGGGGAGAASSSISPTRSSGSSGFACAGILSDSVVRRTSMSLRASTSDDFHAARWSSRCVESDSIKRRVAAGSTDIRLLTAPSGGASGVVFPALYSDSASERDSDRVD